MTGVRGKVEKAEKTDPASHVLRSLGCDVILPPFSHFPLLYLWLVSAIQPTQTHIVVSQQHGIEKDLDIPAIRWWRDDTAAV